MSFFAGAGHREGHLVFWVGVRPAASAVLAKEVVAVFIQAVDVVLVLTPKKKTKNKKKETRTRDQDVRGRVCVGVWGGCPVTHMTEFTWRVCKLAVSAVTAEVPEENIDMDLIIRPSLATECI